MLITICGFESGILDSELKLYSHQSVFKRLMYECLPCVLILDLWRVFWVWLGEEHLFMFNLKCSLFYNFSIKWYHPQFFSWIFFFWKFFTMKRWLIVLPFSYPSHILLGCVTSSVKDWFGDLGFFFFGCHKLTICHIYNK